ncbi:hypothetical protein CMI47_09260 [Candidatus Pacearchaeota archaeon]|nr:hypothetical protein [Candidatus Pacearchaeota archaeon]|tara:strand:+ start:1312 stop:1938 length:627 start_codon:yes stop_codon:yes gene_type:complete
MKEHKRIGILKFALVCCILPGLAIAEPYKPRIISDVPTIEARASIIELSDRSIDVSFSYQTGGGRIYSDLYTEFNPDYLSSLITSSWPILKRYLEEQEIPTRDCRHIEYNLNIFAVNTNILLDEVRFAEFWTKNPQKTTGIYGLFDPTTRVQNESAILVSNFEGHMLNIIFVHEMGHYWWNRLCVATHWPAGAENFSMSFQRYYEATK